MAKENGFVVHIVSFIRTEALFSREIQDRIDSLSHQSITAVFTSMNAADVVISLLNGAKPGWKLFSIGNTTYKTLASYFGEQSIIDTANSAHSLAEIIIKKAAPDKLVFFCGDQRRDELPEMLSHHHVALEEVVVYRTIELNNKIQGIYQGILFFSPSAVNSFFAGNSIAQDVTIFAIGETTAETIRRYCNNEIIISEEPGKEELLKKVLSYYHTQAGKIVR